MTEKKVGVLMDGDKLIGVISETDYTHKIILKGLTSMHTSVKAIMTKRVLYV